jgi:cytosine/adenosine deaminase-related metal-dependent hydrolase
VAVGDISNGIDSFEQKSDSPIFYHTFIELIGLNPANAESIFDRGLQLLGKLNEYQLKGSLAPHAPYSTSGQLIKKIADFDTDRDFPLSIHNQESEEESKFFMGQTSGFDDLYKFLNLDLSWFKAPGSSSLQSYADQLSEKKSLLIHNTFTSAADLAFVANKQVYWCFCPGANLYIENKLPDFSLFKHLEKTICLGTDSLASNKQLDLVEEANQVLKATDVFSLGDILTAMTSNAAEALGITHAFGGFIKNRNAGLNLLTHRNGQLQFIKKIL